MVEAVGYWALPGPSRFVRRASERLLSSPRGLLGISAPARRPAGFVDAIADGVRNGGGGRVFTVDAGDMAFERSIVHGLARSAGSLRQSISSVADLVTAPELAAGSFLVDGIDPSSWHRWSAFLRSYGAEFERQGAELAPGVIAILPPDVVGPDLTHIFGREHHTIWRSTVSSLDTRIFVSGLSGIGSNDPLADRIAYEVIVALSGWDLTTAEALVGNDPQDLLEPVRLIAPGSPAVASWRAGNTDEWDGLPFVSTPVCLANGDTATVQRRTWSAYARVITPFVGEVLEHYCRIHDDLLGRSLPYRHESGDHVRMLNEVSDLEIGPVYHILKDAIPPGEASFLKGIVYLRNRIAHHRLPEVAAVIRLSDAWEGIRYAPGAGTGWNWPRCGQEVHLTDKAVVSEEYAAVVRTVSRAMTMGETVRVDIGGWSKENLASLLKIVPADFRVLLNGSALTDR